MDPQDWKLSVTGENCPQWCTEDHSADAPEHGDSILHISTPITVALPPLVNGDRLRLTFATTRSEDLYSNGRKPTCVEFGTEDQDGVAAHDYATLATANDLDNLIADLRVTPCRLEGWRERLPAATPKA
ncbi:DUF6907 domain-containing protein [Streptomyces lunaelactis]|uniref:DUF6907 domain-containing protein n=1 Tax=Streptomyces lunaelactis TaxID=1535768 RepID=UPI001584CE59|nr:hypothetical protein [Streptomyces lunaelactis]NUK14054.1 hypothetical protein [Streptomyces lunaelactis]